METAAKNLLGTDKKIGGDLTTEEGREQYNKDVLGELTKGGGAKISDLADKFSKNDYAGGEYDALLSLSQSNPKIREAIRDSAKAAKAENTEEGKKKYTQLNALDRQLAEDSGTGGNKYLGVLEILSESLSQLKLFQTSEG
jgi:hypothetical protein